MVDPVSTALAVGTLALRVEGQLRLMGDLEDDAEVLLGLVSSVKRIMLAVGSELDETTICKPESTVAFQGVQDALQSCFECLNSLASKGRIARFLRADVYISDVKTCTDRLAHQMAVLQSALGIERHMDLKRQFDHVRGGLVNLKLEVLQAMQTQASCLRSAVEQQVKEAKIAGETSTVSADKIRAIMMDCLHESGILKGPHKVADGDAAGGSGGDGAGASGSAEATSAADAAEINAALSDLQKELNCMRARKEDHEAAIFEQMCQALEMQARAEAALAERASDGGRAGGAAADDYQSSKDRERSKDGGKPFMPPSFACPITGMCMRDPVMTSLGHTYEREAIQRHLLTNDTDPSTNLVLESKTLIPNVGLRNSIEEWLERHKISYDEADNLMTNGNTTPDPSTATQPASTSKPLPTSPKPAPRPLVRAQPAAPPTTTPAAIPIALASSAYDSRFVSCVLPAGMTGAQVAKYRPAETDEEHALLQMVAGGPLDPIKVKALTDLLMKGTNPDVHDELGNTPLILASRVNDPEAVKVLIKFRAGKEEVDMDANTALLAASKCGHHEVVDVLLASGCNKEFMNREHDNALLAASKLGKALVVQSLLKDHANKGATDKNGQTALMAAAQKGMVAVVDVLLQHGAEKEVTDQEGNTPLLVAAAAGHAEVVHALLLGGADSKKVNTKGESALVIASRQGQARVLKVLLKGGQQPPEELNKALYQASEAGQDEAVRKLLQGGATRDSCPYQYKGTALHAAIQKGHFRAAQALVQHGADMEARHELHCRTALHLAAYHNQVPITRMLLERGANKEAVDEFGYTPLLLACLESNAEVVKVLLDAGADAKARDKKGRSATRLAHIDKDGSADVMQVLIDAGKAEELGGCSCAIM